jgi:hypothetical protein
MSSFKQLSKADVTSVSYAANKQWNLDFFCFPTSSEYITLYKGTNFTGSFSTTEPTSSGQYERLVYDSINHLFYQKYTDNLNTGSIMFDVTTYTSASQQRPTGAYFDYNTNPLLIKNFPTGVNESIRALVVNQDIYGSKVLPNSFLLTSSAYSVTDDGYGNLYDSGSINGRVHIGNLFYAHGIGVITNQDYQSMFPSSSNNCGPAPTTTTTSTTTTTTTLPTTTTTTTSTTTSTTTEPTTTTTTSTTTTTTTEPTTTTTTTTTSTTTTTTTSPTTTTSTTTTTTTAATELLVYGKYINATNDLQYQVNNGGWTTLGTINSLTCVYFFTISGLSNGDNVEFRTVNSYAIGGSPTDCPGSVGCTIPSTTISTGTNYYYVTVDGTNAC